MLDRQAERGDELGAARPLHGEHREASVQILDEQPTRGVRGQPGDDLAGVRGVGDEEDLVVATHVDNQIV